jgi:hypothetical protein
MLLRIPEEVGVLGIGSGPTRLYNIYAQLVQLLSYLKLVPEA